MCNIWHMWGAVMRGALFWSSGYCVFLSANKIGMPLMGMDKTGMHITYLNNINWRNDFI